MEMRGGLLLEPVKSLNSVLLHSKLSPLAVEFIPASSQPPVKRISALSFCYLNARSLLARSSDGRPRFDHLHNYAVVENSFDIILITETHLDQTIDSIEINISGYQLFRNDRNRNGGGVAIYCRDELAPVELLDLQNSEIESLYIKVLECNMPCILGVCYRPPNQTAFYRESTLEALRVQFDYLSVKSKLPFFLLGDFNDRCSSWELEHLESELGQSLVTLLHEFNLSQVINKPTLTCWICL